MAQRRMFCKEITSSDSFTDLSLAAQALYLHLTMDADDDGLISSARKITRSIGAAPEDLKELLEAGFILDLGDNIYCIKHWRMNNYIQKDRYKPSVYSEKVALLYVKSNKAYTLNPDEGTPAAAELVENPVENPVENLDNREEISNSPFEPEQTRLEESEDAENPQSLENKAFNNLDTECIQNVYKMDTQVSIGKYRLDKSKCSINKQQQKTRAYGPHKNVMLTDQEAEALQARFEYPSAILYRVSNYLMSARDRPPEKQNHYALCLKFGNEDGSALRIKEA